MKKLKLTELAEVHSRQELEKQELLHILGGQILPDDYEDPDSGISCSKCETCKKGCTECQKTQK